VKKIEKILTYIDNQKITSAKFERLAGLSNGYIGNMIKSGSEVSPKMWEKILSNVPGIEKIESAERIDLDKTILKGKKVPVYNAQGMAGFDNEADMTPITSPDSYVSADELDISRMCDAVIYVWGNSMLPNISPGTKLGLEVNYDSFFMWGEVMLIETRSNRLIKRVFPSEKGEGWISCHSDNTMIFNEGSRKGLAAYPPIEIPVSDILRKFDVVASQKMHKTTKVQLLRQLRESA
jgi:hypothetical protein